MKTTRQQIRILTELHPSWPCTEIARHIIPPISPQRVNQIMNNVKPDFSSDKYRELHRHKYHIKVQQKYKRKKCKYCNVVEFAP